MAERARIHSTLTGIRRKVSAALNRRSQWLRAVRLLENPGAYFTAAAGKPTGQPFRLRGGPSLAYGAEDDPAFLFEELFLRQCYGIPRFYRPAAGHTILDVGANIGWFALLCQYWARGPIVVHCYEPDPGTLNRLQNNVRTHKPSEIKIHPTAVSNQSEGVTLDRDHHPLCRRVVTGGYLSVPSLTLDQAVAQTKARRIEFLKIDVEGGEVEVLDPATSSVGLRSVERIALEWHDRYRAGTLEFCRAALLRSGFEVVTITYEDDQRDVGTIFAARRPG